MIHIVSLYHIVYTYIYIPLLLSHILVYNSLEKVPIMIVQKSTKILLEISLELKKGVLSKICIGLSIRIPGEKTNQSSSTKFEITFRVGLRFTQTPAYNGQEG